MTATTTARVAGRFSFLARRTAAAAIALGLSAGVCAEGDPLAGKEKTLQCVTCHGADGNSEIPLYPKLAGQHADYIVHSLEQYKTGERENGVMKGFADPLTDQDRADIAAWYASQKSTLGTVDPEN